MIRYSWKSDDFLHIYFTGNVYGEEIVSFALDISGDERLDYTRFVLGDWSQYRHANVNQENVRRLIAVMKAVCQVTPKVKNATVIKQDKTGNAIPAFYKMLADELPWQIEIFHSLEEAYDWFDIQIPCEKVC